MSETVGGTYYDSYEGALALAGATVLAFKRFGSYQGTWWAKLPDGYIRGSYGSCSGCDEVEGLTSCYEHWGPGPASADCEACQRHLVELKGVGERYLADKRYTQEEAEAKASENLSWDMDAKEEVAWLKGQREGAKR